MSGWVIEFCLFLTLLVLFQKSTLGYKDYPKEDLNLEYNVYTKDAPLNKKELIDINPGDNKKTVFLTHGFLTQSMKDLEKVKDAILARDGASRVIVVSWKKYNIGIYNEIAENTVPRVAATLARQFEKFDCDIELVGHSLGAHIMGQASRIYNEKNGKTIKKIYGKA